jgi:hypothetical protein
MKEAPMSAGKEMVSSIKVKAFARPEDVSSECAYKTDPWTVYATDIENVYEVSSLRGLCMVVLDDKLLTGMPISSEAECTQNHRLFASLCFSALPSLLPFISHERFWQKLANYILKECYPHD